MRHGGHHPGDGRNAARRGDYPTRRGAVGVTMCARLSAAYHALVMLVNTQVATINEALRIQALRIQGQEIAAAFQRAQMDFSGSADAFGYSGGRDLSRLADDARDQNVA
jgi:hypothetical protein